jgi:hypothetical protein
VVEEGETDWVEGGVLSVWRLWKWLQDQQLQKETRL